MSVEQEEQAAPCALCLDGGSVELVAVRNWAGEIVEFDGVYVPCPKCSGDVDAASPQAKACRHRQGGTRNEK